MLAVLQLQDYGILLRTVNPDTITISCDYHSLTFNDLGAASNDKGPLWRARDAGMPYDASRQSMYGECREDDFLWDEYSVGIIVLEVFFGTAMVSELSSLKVLNLMLKESRRYLDEAANGMLMQLFRFLQEPGEPEIWLDPRRYLTGVLEVDQEHIRGNILRAKVALEESTRLKNMLPVLKVQPITEQVENEGGASPWGSQTP
jgi:hypothetical protein